MNLTEEELKSLHGAKRMATVRKLQAETAAVESGRALAEANAAELEYENTLLRIYLSYGLGLTDNYIINETTGEIQQKEDNDNQEDNQEDGQENDQA